MRKKVISEFTRLSQIHQQHLRLAVFVALSEEAIDSLGRSLRHQPHVVGRVRQFQQGDIGIFRFLGIDHAGANAGLAVQRYR